MVFFYKYPTSEHLANITRPLLWGAIKILSAFLYAMACIVNRMGFFFSDNALTSDDIN